MVEYLPGMCGGLRETPNTHKTETKVKTQKHPQHQQLTGRAPCPLSLVVGCIATVLLHSPGWPELIAGPDWSLTHYPPASASCVLESQVWPPYPAGLNSLLNCDLEPVGSGLRSQPGFPPSLTLVLVE